MKWKLVLLILVMVLFFGGQLYFVFNPQPGSRAAQGYSLARDSPPEFFYPVFGGILVLVGGITTWIYIAQKRYNKVAPIVGAATANQIASTLWNVQNSRPHPDTGWVVSMNPVGLGTRPTILPVRAGHPDIDTFRSLKNGDTIEFRALPQGMECALPHELCGYLRIKSIS